MDKKLLIGLGLAVSTGGAALIVLGAFKTVRKVKVRRKRKQLKKLAKKYFKGNQKVLDIIDGLSSFEVRVIFKIWEKTGQKAQNFKLPEAISSKLPDVVKV